MTTKERLHQLVDELAESDVATAERILEALRDTVVVREYSIYDAPVDDEPETPEEAAAVAEAYEDIKAGRVVSHEEVMRRFGLT